MSTHQGYIWPNLAGGPVISDKQGLDYLIVQPGQQELELHFLEPIDSLLENPGSYVIRGGERITDVGILSAARTGSRTVLLTLDKFGDWAPYRLVIREAVWDSADLDPVFSWIEFTFKVDCPSDIDCRRHGPGFENFPDLYDFDYQAKDYESFKQAMLDRLPTTLPDYWDRAEADFGIAVIDLLAYVGDRLSYYQDRVAAESQLSSARSREAVAGHLKLLDYTLDPGQTATAYICIEVNRDLTVSAGTRVETPARDVPDETPVTFTLIEPFEAYRDLNRLEPYDFSHPSLLIPRGATRLTIKGHPAGLKSGRCIFVRSADAAGDPRYHRVTLSDDPIYKTAPDGSDITVLQWGASDALPWDAGLAATALLGNAADFVHGNLEPAGKSSSWYVDQDLTEYDLAKGPLGYRKGRPLINIRVDGELWQRVSSLKTSQPFDPHYQIVDQADGKNRVLFGDNINGRRPPKYALIEMSYLAGLGRAGNTSANTLTRLPAEVKGIVSVYNPLPASGGRDPETEAHAKLWGPKTIRRQ